MRIKKTPKMYATERQIGEVLETALPRLLNDRGVLRTAQTIGIPRTTLDGWLGKFGITMVEVALRPGESVEVVQPPRHSAWRRWAKGTRS